MALKKIVKESIPGFIPFFRRFKFSIRTFFLPRLRNINTSQGRNNLKLGSDEHGWTFLDRDYLYGSTILSVGLGEDASFDIEFCNRFASKVIIVDPTPRSTRHFSEIAMHFGEERSADYMVGGKQLIQAYDLSKISNINLVYIASALWKTTEEVQFFAPENPEHTSYSITNLQGTDDSITVQALTYRDLLLEVNEKAEDIKLLKLDIEGAATEVISSILLSGFRPNQILVEFEELANLSVKNYRKLRNVSKLLINCDYVLVYSDFQTNFTFELITSSN